MATTGRACLLLWTVSWMGLLGCATGEDAVDVVSLGDAARGDTTLSDETHSDGTPAIDSATTSEVLDETAVVEDSAAKDATSIFETDVDCDAGTTACGTTCVNLANNEMNCGKCGKSCAATEKCLASVCQIVCTAPTTRCGSAPGTCVNTNNDEKNCGSCGKTCAAGETCKAGDCTPPPTTVTFPSTTSTTFRSYDGASTPLGAGGGRAFYIAGDYVQQSFARAAAVTKLTVNFKMSDGTYAYCGVGTLNWNIYVNGTVVGSYSWIGGTMPYSFSPPMGPDQTISKTISFAAIAPAGGNFTLRFQAANTVCGGGGAWNWFAGGTATLE